MISSSSGAVFCLVAGCLLPGFVDLVRYPSFHKNVCIEMSFVSSCVLCSVLLRSTPEIFDQPFYTKIMRINGRGAETAYIHLDEKRHSIACMVV